MSLDDLHHDHAELALMVDATVEELNVRVAAVLGAERAADCVVFAHDKTVDVPIPLIFEIDAYTRARLPDGELYVSFSGEAYDRQYALHVQVRRGDERPWILPLRPITDEEAQQLWQDGWPTAQRAGLTLASDEERIALLQALMPDTFAADIEAIGRWAAGLAG